MFGHFKLFSTQILQCAKLIVDPKRSTYILRRKHPIPLGRLGEPYSRKLKRKSFFYEVVENKSEQPQPLIDLLLTKSVKGIGVKGQLIKVEEVPAYEEFIVPGRAVYATREIVEEFASKNVVSEILFAVETVCSQLEKEIIPVLLSDEREWVLEPWHVSASLRRRNIITSADCITLPQKKISGPSEALDQNDFYATIAINEEHSFPLRCRIFLTASPERFQFPKFTKEENLDSARFIFPEDAARFESLQKEEELKYS